MSQTTSHQQRRAASKRAATTVAHAAKPREMPDAFLNFDRLPDSALVRLPVVKLLFSCSDATAYRWIKEGRLPTPVKLSTRCMAWRVGDLRNRLTEVAL